MLFRITLVDKTTVSAAKISGNEIDTIIDNGRQQNN